MVQMYKVFGMNIGSHNLALAVLGTTFGGAYLATRGGSKKTQDTNTPPINASSKEEEAFINEFLKNAEAEAQKAKK